MPRSSDPYARIYAVAKRVPRGRVATYGQIAALAGLPRHARLVGHALKLPPADGVPWHRIVNAHGRISPRANALGHEDLQEQLLEREGVRLIEGAISLERFQWRPKR